MTETIDKPTRKKPNHFEAVSQRALIKWAEMQSMPPALDIKAGSKIADYLFAIPNGGKRDRIEAALMKAEGAKAGVWDLDMPLARGHHIGLWIEMKWADNGLSPKQVEWRELMELAGHKCLVFNDWTLAAAALVDYLRTPRTVIHPPRRRVLEVLDRVEAEGELAHPKERPVRSPKYLREVAKEACANCGRQGYSQAAHANKGKGLAIKSADNRTFPLCTVGPHGQGCHEKFDQYQLGTREESAAMAERWTHKTYQALKRAGRVPLSVPAPRF